MPVLHVDAFTYGDYADTLSFDLEPGACLGISGPSGSGKTRLLRALADLDPWKGVLTCQGLSPTRMPAHRWRQSVMWLPADSLWWTSTVREGLAPISDAVPRLLDCVGLDCALLDAPTAHLSSGEKQRLSLVRALLLNPVVLLLDEPTAHVDAPTRQHVESCIDRARKERGLSCLWISHDREQLNRVADSILLLNHPGGQP